MRRLSLVMALVLLIGVLFCMPVFAAPETLPADTVAMPNTIFTVTNPNAQTASTSDAYYTITGYGTQGVKLTFYSLTTFGGYQPVLQNGVPVTWTIGASRLFAQRLPLRGGRNAVLVVAEKDGQIVQINSLQITKIVQSTTSRFLGFSLFR